MPSTRRQFLATGLRAGLALPALGMLARPGEASPIDDRPDLLRRFPDLRRHFVFEYYPWYGGPPDYEHWDYLDRKPPLDIASPYMPRLGPYDVRSPAVLEQHARWIKEAGVGAIALSWWGRGSWQDQRRPTDHGRDAGPRRQGHVRDGALRGRPRAALFATTSSTSCGSTARSADGTRSSSCAMRTARRVPSSRASAASCPRPPPTASATPLRSPTTLPTPSGGGRRTSCARPCARTSTTSPSSPTPWSSGARRPPASTGSESTTTTSRPSATPRWRKAPRGPA